MTEIGITTLMLIIANIFCSVTGLNDRLSFERFKFRVDQVLNKKNKGRLVSSGFFHVNGLHLTVNVLSLCFFSGGVELLMGPAKYLLIYFVGLIGGNLFSLFLHRRHYDYCAAGASGAVSAIIFATVVLFPHYQIGFLGLHFPIPGWFYGFLYVLFSIYGIKSKRDNIGHEANLAGGLVGLLVAVLLMPSAIATNYLAFFAVTIPCMFFIFIILTRPQFILIDNLFFCQQKRKLTSLHVLQLENVDHQVEVDRILEKIHQQGMASLSEMDREKLDYYSKFIR